MNLIQRLQALNFDCSEIICVEQITSGVYTSEDGNRFSNLPDFCRVVLHSRPGRGSFIRSEVWLPTPWNGLFVGIGNGGLGAGIPCKTMTKHLRQGYAIAGTDLGTSRGRECGIDNPDVWKDFGWRATHLMTVTAKQILREYYGEPEKYAYFLGRSTGGQQAYCIAQRFPEDYDGIIAGVPAHNRLALHTYFLWNHVHLTTESGEGLFSDEEISSLTNCAVEFFRLHGGAGLRDDFVSFPYAGERTVEDFLGFLRTAMPGLSEAQRSALRAVYTGPVNPVTGEQIYNGMPMGAEIYGCGIRDCQGKEPPFYFPILWAFGEEFNFRNFDFASDMDHLHKTLAADLNANSSDLSAFRDHGGKLLAFSGSADPCVPYPDAMAYYNRTVEFMGGTEETQKFYRYFLIPGKDHGATGRGANSQWGSIEQREDLLTVLRRWREEGIAPDTMAIAHIDLLGDEETFVFTREIQPYPGGQQPGTDFPSSCCKRYL